MRYAGVLFATSSFLSGCKTVAPVNTSGLQSQASTETTKAFCETEDCYQEIAEKYAPLLKFDSKIIDVNISDQMLGKTREEADLILAEYSKKEDPKKCLPSRADDFYELRKNGSKDKVCNVSYSHVKNGWIPIYYRYEACSSDELGIEYWVFYGYQHTCFSTFGDHEGDWEHIKVKIKRDANGTDSLAKVAFAQHSGWYTRLPGDFEKQGEHPVAYVGKNSHGSYHNKGGIGGCGYFDDFRNPGSDNKYFEMETWKNLIPLKTGDVDPEWMKYQGKGNWGGSITGPLDSSRGEVCKQKSCSHEGCQRNSDRVDEQF